MPPCSANNFTFSVETGSQYVAWAGLQLLASSNPPASGSQSAGIIDHGTWLPVFLSFFHLYVPNMLHNLWHTFGSVLRILQEGRTEIDLTCPIPEVLTERNVLSSSHSELPVGRSNQGEAAADAFEGTTPCVQILFSSLHYP